MMTLVLTTCKPSPIEEGEGTTGQDDGYIMLVFNEKKSANRDTSPDYTSPDSDTESALSHLDVMMYKYNKDNYTYEPFYHERVDVTQYPDGTAYLKRKKDDFEPDAQYKIYVVANSTHSESVFKPEGTAVISHENLMKLDQTDEYIHLSGIKGGNNIYPQYFLMDGVAYMGDEEPENPSTLVINSSVANSDNIVINVKLRRAAAKFVIKIYPGENVVFSQQLLAQSKGYMMRNMPIRTRVVAEGKYPNNNPAYWKSSTISQSPYFEYVQEDNDKYHLRVTLYCYSHRWNSAEFFDKGTSFVFMLPIVYSGTEYINNYYQLVINKQEAQHEEYDHIIKRNTLYELRVKLNAPGAEDFTEPEELEDIHYFTAPWTEKTLNIDGESTVAYLKVNKDKLYMYNIAEDNTSLYFSSSSPVTTEIVSNSVYYYNKYGNKVTQNATYIKNNIKVSTNAYATSGNININSAIPTNKTIQYFTIKVTNQEGLSELIEVEQYPLIYVTNMLPWYSYRDDYYYRTTGGHTYDKNCSTDRDKKNLPTTYSYGGDRIASVHVSSVSNNGTIKYKYNRQEGSKYGFFSSKYRGNAAGGNKYQNLFYRYSTSGSRQNGDDECEKSANLRNYHIRVMASSDKYTLGRPRIDENGYTASDEENAKLVSPSFVIASRLGAVYSTSGGLSNLTNEQKLIVFADHAKNYVEVDDIDDAKDPNRVVVYDNWRLPTRAELEIIIELQGTANQDADAVDYLLNGAYYMSASGPVYNNKHTSSSSSSDVAIRCVRDVYYE